MASQHSPDVLEGFREELKALRSTVQDQKATNDRLVVKCDTQNLYIDLLMKQVASHETRINEHLTSQQKCECRHLEKSDKNEHESIDELRRQIETQGTAINTLRNYAFSQRGALPCIAMHQQDCTRLHKESAQKLDRQSDINDELLALHNAHSAKLDRQSEINDQLHARDHATSTKLTELTLSDKTTRRLDGQFQMLLDQQQNHTAILSDLESKRLVATMRRLKGEVKALQGGIRQLRPVRADLKSQEGMIRTLWPLLKQYDDLKGMIEDHSSDIQNLGGDVVDEVNDIRSQLKNLDNLHNNAMKGIKAVGSVIKGLDGRMERSFRVCGAQERAYNDRLREIGGVQGQQAEALGALTSRLDRVDRSNREWLRESTVSREGTPEFGSYNI